VATQQNNGQVEEKLDYVRRGEPITADAWNKLVARANKPLDVSIKRTRRAKANVSGTKKSVEFVTAIVVQNGRLVWTTDTIDYLEPE